MSEVDASQLSGPVMDYFYKRQLGRSPTPDSRILLLFPGIIALWVGVLVYDWTPQYRLLAYS
jgi:hypothetical protein